MSFARPTLADLITRVEADFVSSLGLEGAVLRRSLVAIFARVVAGAVHMLYGFLEFMSRQFFADTAEAEYLERIASVFGIVRTAATYATGTVEFTGVDTTVIPEGTRLVRSDGAIYETDEEVAISGTTIEAAVTALTAGADYSLEVDVELTLESPIEDIDPTAPVTASGVDGSDAELDASLRERLLARLRNPPHGGALADYEQWAREVAGVTRVWVTPEGLGAGTVLIYFVRDGDVDIIPDAGEIAEVQDYIDERRPVTAAVTVAAPTTVELDFDIHIVPENVSTKAAVTAELVDLLARVGEPGGTVLLSRMLLAIGQAEGVTDFRLDDPVADYTAGASELPILGTITWTA